MIATYPQAKSCGHRIYGNRKLSHDERVDRDEMKRRMRAKGVKQVHLANALGIDPDKVSKSLDRKGTRTFTDEEMRIVRQLLREDGDPIEASDYPLLPIIGQVQAGQWREAVDQPRGHMSSPIHNPPRRTFALEVVGDSMDMIVRPGARIMVDPDDKSLFPGKLYVVVNADGETTFKQFYADPARLAPCSTNPSHSVIELGGEEPFTIVGRVIGSYQPF